MTRLDLLMTQNRGVRDLLPNADIFHGGHESNDDGSKPGRQGSELEKGGHKQSTAKMKVGNS
jgi:hypothetical protein